MSEPSTTAPRHHVLRQHAEDGLKGGHAARSRGWLTSQDALSLLYKLASSPESAGDALKLLHELQVYQVELDLQQDHLEAREREQAEDLACYTRLYDFAPVAYFSVSPTGEIERANAAGATLFGRERIDISGRRLDDLLLADSHGALERLLAQARDGGREMSCEVHGISGDRFHVKAGPVPGASTVLLVLLKLTESGKPAPPS